MKKTFKLLLLPTFLLLLTAEDCGKEVSDITCNIQSGEVCILDNGTEFKAYANECIAFENRVAPWLNDTIKVFQCADVPNYGGSVIY